MSKYIATLGTIQDGALEVTDDLEGFLMLIGDLIADARDVLYELCEDDDEDGREYETFEGVEDSLIEARSHLEQSISYLMTAVK